MAAAERRLGLKCKNIFLYKIWERERQQTMVSRLLAIKNQRYLTRINYKSWKQFGKKGIYTRKIICKTEIQIKWLPFIMRGRKLWKFSFSDPGWNLGLGKPPHVTETRVFVPCTFRNLRRTENLRGVSRRSGNYTLGDRCLHTCCGSN